MARITMNRLRLFLQPTCPKIALLAGMMFVSSAVTTHFEATSKVTWHASRGIPFAFVTIFEYVQGGRCIQNTLCVATNIQDLHPTLLLLNMLTWYLVSCGVVLLYGDIRRRLDIRGT